MTKRHRTASPNRLVSMPPVPGTTYWTCRTPDCVDQKGKRSKWPLRVIKPNGQTSKTGTCGRCFRCRPMTPEESQLITGDPATGKRPMHGLIYQIATQRVRGWVDLIEEARSTAYEAACHAALTFDPATGHQFTTHLVVHVKGRLNERFRRLNAIIYNPDGETDVILESQLQSPTEDGHGLRHFAHDRQPPIEDHIDALEAILIAMAKAKLSKREQTVIRLRFGLDREVQTLTEVGEKLGVVRERVRQIERKTLEKLRRAIGSAA